MEVFPVASELLKSLVAWLPPFFLRWYYSPARLAQLVYVDLMPRNESALLNLGSAATFRLAMQVINLSPFSIELDRAVIRLNCGTSPLEASNLERRTIRPGEVTSVYFQNIIADGHADQIVQYSPDNAGGLDGVFEFNSRLHQFTRQVPHLSGIQFKRVNDHMRKREA
jgi:hypothetical protein